MANGAAGSGNLGPAGETSYHVRLACEGDRQSLDWIVEKLSPLLLASARYRLRRSLRSVCDPEDIVQEVWLTTLPKLKDIECREGRYTPVLLKFLSSTLLHKLSNIFQKHIKGKPRRAQAPPDGGEEPLDSVKSDWTGVITRVLRKEVGEAVTSSLEQLSLEDLELAVLRGIEQHSYEDIAILLKQPAKSLAVRYSRILKKLRARVPESVFAELIE